MSIHLEAAPGAIAPSVLITGDPLRAKYHAEHWLSDPICYSRVRGMFGYTGTFEGHRVSIQGTGIGIPSTALYLHELIQDYGVKNIIRVGTCGAIQKDLPIGKVLIATSSETDSAAVSHYQVNKSASAPHPELLKIATQVAQQLKISFQCGPAFSTDLFYSNDKHRYDQMIADGVLGVDMETAMLFAMAQFFQIRALSVLTVSDNILTGEAMAALDRERCTLDMVKLALSVVTSLQESTDNRI